MSALWVYVRIQAMMFVFGLVGPIFLVVYFAAQPDTTLRWMYWWGGLFITAGDVLLALLLAEGDGAHGSRESRQGDRRAAAGPGC